MLLGSRPESRAESGIFDLAADVVRSLLPAIERFDVAAAAEIQIDTLAERLRDEVVGARGLMVYPPLVGAWARVSPSDM